MTDIILELVRAIVIGGLVVSLIRASRVASISQLEGWQMMVNGFMLILFGSVIDITDNFEGLNRFVVIGNTDMQAFLEKVVGYLLGFILLTLGIRRWLPKLIEHDLLTRERCEVQEERLKVFRATMTTVQNIVNNSLQRLQLFRFKANKSGALDPESLALLDSIVDDTAAKLKKLGDLDSIHEKQLPGGIGIDYESIDRTSTRKHL